MDFEWWACRLRTCHSINVNWDEIEVGLSCHVNRLSYSTGASTYHLFKEMTTGRAGCHSDLDFPRQSLGLLGSDQQCVDSGGSIEMSDALLLQELPEEWVINLSQTDIGAPDSDS